MIPLNIVMVPVMVETAPFRAVPMM
jgi:hypothetical protein